jgi:hypothetical protein
MLAKQVLLLSSLVSLIQAEETVLGVYIFHRHGDRTSKSFTPTVLTDLGYAEVYASGEFYRKRYVDANASSPIFGLAHDLAVNSQLNVQAPVDIVLQNSAAGFLQALYPPVGASLGTQALANGSSVEAPMNGFQLIPVNAVASAASSASSENSAWLQGSSGCNNAVISSNNYLFSQEYLTTLNKTTAFYQNLLPVINATISAGNDNFKNAYSSKYIIVWQCSRLTEATTVFDLIHVSEIHNLSIPSDDLLTPEVNLQLQVLANEHEFGLAYNASDKVRAISGSTLAAQIVQQLNTTVTGKSKVPVGIQFGAYAAFLSFFGLAQLPAASVNFTGIVDYASAMTFELVTNATVSNTSYPSGDDISVRFLFSNGTASENPLNAYPLFGQNETVIPWNTFVTEMNKFAIGDQGDWCTACGNTTGVCASTVSASGSTPSSTPSSSGSGGISKAVAGVIGAFVTLAVILGLQALILLVGGLRIAKKRSASGTGPPENQTGGTAVKA